MAVHMSEEEFIALGIEVQQAGFDALNQQLDTSTAHVEKLDQAVQSAGSGDGFEKLNKQVQETNENLKYTKEQLDAIIESSNQAAIGYGKTGGLIGPAEAESGGGLQLTGLRRTGSALSQLGLGEIGRPVSLIGDVQQISKTVEDLGGSLEHLPGLFGAAAAEGEALAGGFGSLIAVAGPLALAVGAVAVGFKVFITDTLEPANKALQEATASVDAYYGAIGKGNKESLQKQLDDLENQKKLVDEKVGTLTNALGQGFSSAQQQFGDLGARLITAGENAGAFGGGVQGVNKDLEDAKKQSEALQGQIDGLNRALGSSTVATNDAATAEKALQDQRDKAADKNIQAAVQTSQLEQTGTSKGVQDRVNAIEAERNAIVKELGDQQVSLDKRIELGKRLSELSEEEFKLTNTILPAVQAREAEDKAIKDTEKSINDITRAHESYDKAVQSAKESLDNQIATAKAREGLAEKENRPGSLQDTEQREKIRLDEGRKETELAQETADRLVDIRAKEGQEEQHIQVELQRQFADDTTKFQEQQQTDAMDHEQRLAEIRRSAQDAELDDIANRDFAKLAQDQEGAKKQESQEDQKFAQQEQKLAIHLQQEEKQQQIAAQRRLDDLRSNEALQIQEQQTAEQRKLEALRQSEQYQLDDLTTAEGYKIQILRVGLQNELTMLQAASTQRMQILQNELQAAQQRASQQIYQANSGGTGAFGFAHSLQNTGDALSQLGEALFGS